jgi:hypothetical protein
MHKVDLKDNYDYDNNLNDVDDIKEKTKYYERILNRCLNIQKQKKNIK